MGNVYKNDFWSILRADEVSDFMDLLSLAEKILKRKTADIDVLKGGLTNKSFKVTFEDGLEIVMRLAGRGTGEFINRSAEKYNSQMAYGMGIAPEVYYFDADTGSQLVEFVKMPTMHLEDYQKDVDVLQKSAKLLSVLHNSSIKFRGRFDAIAGTKEYMDILKNKNYTDSYEGWADTYKMVERIGRIYAKNPSPLAPCHNDVLAENFMYDRKTMYLIDWEYGGVGDPYYDASGPLTEDVLDEKMTEVYLKAYFNGDPTPEQRARIFIGRFLYCTYWCAWSLVQIANGKEHDLYWQYGLDRANLGKEYMSDPEFEKYLKILGG